MTSVLAQHLVNTLVAGSALALFAVGFGLIYSTVRFFHFAHSVMYTIGAYAAYVLVIEHGFPKPVGIASALTIVGILGGLFAICVFEPLRRSHASSLVLFLTSIGLLVVLQNFISLIFGDQTYALSRAPVKEGLPFLGAQITLIQFATVVISISIIAGLWAVLRLTRFGKMLRAISVDIDLSEAVGVPTSKMIIAAFILSAVLAGTSGILSAYDIGLVPSMGFSALLLGIVAAVVGGIGKIRGTLLGSLLIAAARTLAIVLLPSQWQDAIVFLILIIFLILRPQGIIGKPFSKMSL